MKLLIFTFLFTQLASAKELQIDAYHSTISFEATHIMISKIPGRFKKFTGKLDINDKDFTKSKFDITVDVNSVDTSVEKRDEHLRSMDFFDVKNHPTAIFKSKFIKKSGDLFVVDGEVTIRGVTKPISLLVKKAGVVQDPMMKVEKNVFQATGELNRKDFGVSWGDETFLGNNIKLSINLEGMK